MKYRIEGGTLKIGKSFTVWQWGAKLKTKDAMRVLRFLEVDSLYIKELDAVLYYDRLEYLKDGKITVDFSISIEELLSNE